MNFLYTHPQHTNNSCRAKKRKTVKSTITQRALLVQCDFYVYRFCPADFAVMAAHFTIFVHFNELYASITALNQQYVQECVRTRVLVPNSNSEIIYIDCCVQCPVKSNCCLKSKFTVVDIEESIFILFGPIVLSGKNSRIFFCVSCACRCRCQNHDIFSIINVEKLNVVK